MHSALKRSSCAAIGAPLLFALLLGACSTGPPLVSTGFRESPCDDDSNCEPSNFCIEVDGDRFCSRVCSAAGMCGVGYRCDLSAGVCMPTRAGACRQPEERCGPSFEGCCANSRCVALELVGRYCAQTCSVDSQCQTGCCAEAGEGGRVCVPPFYCGR